MKHYLAALLGASILLTGCATADSHGKMKKEMKPEMAMSSAVEQAKADLKAAKAAGGHWRVIDKKATGGKAQNLSKLLKVAEKKAKEGDMAEADRIAKKVSKFATMGQKQSELYKGSTPYYN